MKSLRGGFYALLTILAFTAGCVTRDPLKGWKLVGSDIWGYRNRIPADKIILNDAEHFVNDPANGIIGEPDIYYFEEKSGRHAIKLEAMFSGRYWNYVLIYDKANVRVKTIKYSSGRYNP